MANYIQKRKTLIEKFKHFEKKFVEILDKTQANPQLFTSILIDPSKGISSSEETKLLGFITKICNLGMDSEFKECKETRDNAKSTDIQLRQSEINTARLSNQPLLEKIKTHVEQGTIDIEDILGTDNTQEDEVEMLVSILESKIQQSKSDTDNTLIKEMNVMVREFRASAKSLYEEFSQTRAADKNEYGIKGAKVRSSYDNDFKDGTDSTLQAQWKAKASESREVAIVELNLPVATIHVPKLHERVNIDSDESMKNLLTMSYHHFYSVVGQMQLLYVKNFALPYLINSVCSIFGGKTDLAGRMQDSIELRKAKFAISNYKVIFGDMESDYSSNIDSTFRKMQDVRVTGMSYDLTEVLKGIRMVAIMSSFESSKHGSAADFLNPDFNLCDGKISLAMIGDASLDSHDEL